MRELGARLAEASQHLSVTLGEDELRQGEARLRRRLARRRRLRATAGAVLVVLLAAGAALRGWSAERPLIGSGAFPGAGTHDPQTGLEVVRFSDGSRATLVRGARVVQSGRGADIEVALEAGLARFDVTRRDERTFRVRAGSVTVEVLGTAFTVERAGPGAQVAVERGRVKVGWSDGQVYLHAGQSGHFPPAPPAAGPGDTAPAVPTADPTPAVATNPPASLARSQVNRKAAWQHLARRGEYERAYEALGAAGPTAVRDVPEDLLAAADVARLSGHPRQALGPLRRLLDRHRGDARAPLAAFTLGRTLLDELREPRAAAEAFALMQRLDPRSPLAEDALAREVEAWARAGLPALARERASVYMRRFPDGRRREMVERLGGTSAP